MAGFMMCLALTLAATPDQPVSYQDAYEEANKSKRPMLVLVGADWCPACRVMKYTTLPGLLKDGKLKQVSYSIVDVDEAPQLSSQLMRSSSIPQLVLLVPLTDGWQRYYLNGSHHPDSVVEMIRGGIADQKQDLADNKKEMPTMPVASANE